MDILSDVLSVTRLGSSTLGSSVLVPPWGLIVDLPAHHSSIHYFQRGGAWLRINDEPSPRRIGEGDLVLVASGINHVLTDQPNTPARPIADVLKEVDGVSSNSATPDRFAHTKLFCAKYIYDHPGPHPMAALLPSVIHIRAQDVEQSAQLQALVQVLRLELNASGSGGDLVVPRLLDSLLVLILRAWIAGLAEGEGGWLGATRNSAISRALRLIHDDPKHDWTVEKLANAIGQSRATFARQFQLHVGETPLAYVTKWRLCLAAKYLRESDAPLDKVAYDCGYASAAAFSKAFNRQFAVPPGQYRFSAE